VGLGDWHQQVRGLRAGSAIQPTALQRASASSAAHSKSEPAETVVTASADIGAKGILDFAPWTVSYTENGATLPGKWFWDKAKQEFTAAWNGFSNTLKVETFNDSSVVLTGTNAYGASLKYAGVRHGNKVTGTGSWIYKDATGKVTTGQGDWHASW
jgi:hypothetical protein